MVLGASFSPEYCEQIGIKDPLEAPKFIHKELGIKNIRFGLRWNKIDNGKELSLDYYRKYLDYLFRNDIEVCLNVGPIKVFRWPEEHIPAYLQDYYISNVQDTSDIAQKSKAYFTNLMHLLQEEYGSHINNVIFQVENEAFNRFGHIKALMSLEYVFSISKILFERYPNASLMIDSSGRTNLRKIVKLFERIRATDSFHPESLILGINYYFKLPHTLPFFKSFDPMKLTYPWDMSLRKLHRKSTEIDFSVEITEGQFEPWGVQNTPGNSYEDFVYLLDKCKEIFPSKQKKKLVRLWGVEEFAKKFLDNSKNKVHERIAKRIISINSNMS